MKTGPGRPVSGKAAYRVTIVVACLVALYFSTVVTLANVFVGPAPGFVLDVWPSSAAAHVRMADDLVMRNPTRPPVDRVREHALAALRRSPVVAAAARNLGMVASLRRDSAGALARLHYAERMSRRDVLTQLALIESRVSVDDVAGALVHYGIALRVSPATQQLLFPVLAGALDRPNLVVPIARLVQEGESWRSTFLYYVNEHSRNLGNATALYTLLARAGTPPAPVHIMGLLTKLLRANQYDDAVRLYALADPRWRRDDPNAQLDGGFDRTGDVTPLGWALAAGVASRDARTDAAGNVALQLVMPESGTALAARRVLLLPPGSYRLTGTIGRLDGQGQGNVRIELTCPDAPAGTNLVTAPIPAQRASFSGTLQVAGCAQQWFSIIVERGGEPGAMTAWVDDLRLEPASAVVARAGR